MTKTEKTILLRYASGKEIADEETELVERAAAAGLICFGTGCENDENGNMKSLHDEARLTRVGHRYLHSPIIPRCIYYIKRNFQLFLVKFYYKMDTI